MPDVFLSFYDLSCQILKKPAQASEPSRESHSWTKSRTTCQRDKPVNVKETSLTSAARLAVQARIREARAGKLREEVLERLAVEVMPWCCSCYWFVASDDFVPLEVARKLHRGQSNMKSLSSLHLMLIWTQDDLRSAVRLTSGMPWTSRMCRRALKRRGWGLARVITRNLWESAGLKDTVFFLHVWAFFWTSATSAGLFPENISCSKLKPCKITAFFP